MTKTVFPGFGSVALWRDVVKRNRFDFARFSLRTNETWLPRALVAAGFFRSGSQVKKNLPDLWRDLQTGFDEIDLGWANIFVFSEA